MQLPAGDEDDALTTYTDDVLLPKHMPNVDRADMRVDRPLECYPDTLSCIAECTSIGRFPDTILLSVAPASRGRLPHP